jgi:hypothetical protein
MHKRIKKDGTEVLYAGPLCFDCRRAYNRELRRMNNRLAGRATRPQDVPWKRYRPKNVQLRVGSGPFFEWFDEYLEKTGLSVNTVCKAVGITEANVRRYRSKGRMDIHSAERFFLYADQPHMTVVLYPELQERKAA